MALLPLTTSFKGPAPKFEGGAEDMDIVGEALYYFKANIFFRNYEIKHSNKDSAIKDLTTFSLGNLPIPGDSGFPLNAMFKAPGKGDEDTMKAYLLQLRQESQKRLVELVYAGGAPSKWWMCFAKKKFMEKTLTHPGN